MNLGDEMKREGKQFTWTRFLRAISSVSFVCVSVYVLFAGFNFAASLVLISSFSGIAAPAVMAADSALECVTGFFEALLDGLLSIFEFIGNIFG
jgi:hypothetical protein